MSMYVDNHTWFPPGLTFIHTLLLTQVEIALAPH